MTATLVMTAVFSLPPLVDLARPGSHVTASLRTTLAYELIAPVSNILDALTLLAPVQYWATFALCVVTFLGFWTYRSARSRAGFVPARFARAALVFVGGTIAIVGVMLVATRPMASLALHDPQLIAVDFHSHTDASHDGRVGFDPDRNREWHSSSGFDAAYVTDHRTFDGALSGATRNPARSGDATVLLPGVELRDGDEHPILLGADPKRMRITSPDWGKDAVEAQAGPAPPMLLLTVPGNLRRIPSAETQGPVRLAGVEVSDGSPRGMAQAARDRAAILALAGKLHLAVLSGSDNHGWGRTAPAWSVLRIPGWRDMTPEKLDVSIRRAIATQGPRAISVIARRTPPLPGNRVETALGGVPVALTMMRTMSLGDRLSWLVWSWGLCFLSLRNARRKRHNRRARARKRAEGKLMPGFGAAA
jgi:predicted metal-dependent phosphoesterase TrpH